MKQSVYFGECTKVPFFHCPACGGLADGATSASLDNKSSRPGPGAFTVCLLCGALLIFQESAASTSGLSARMVSVAEFQEVERRNPALAAMLLKLQQAARELKFFKGRRRG